jgi:mono/diheme cytochrome c family protein
MGMHTRYGVSLGLLNLLAILSTVGCGDETTPVASDGETGQSETQGSETGTNGESGESGETGETGDEPIACQDQPGPWDYGWTIPGPVSVPGDPVAGEWALLNEDYVSCGIPYNLFQLGKGFLGTYADGESLAWREGKNANLPYNWNVVVTEAGTELAAMNCLTCHAGQFNGELVFGLGRHDADFTTDFGALLGLLPTLPEFTDEGVQINKFKGRYEALGPYIKTFTVGTNPADDVAVILAAHRNPFTLEWSDEMLVEVDPPLLPVDTPPWWRVAKKGGHFYNGMSRGDHRGTMMFASSLCVDTAAQAVEMLGYFADITAYLESLEAPEYMWAINPDLAAEGKELFDCTCAGCHGTYDEVAENETYPNLLIPLDVIGTDPLVAAVTAAEGQVMLDWFNESVYGTVSELVGDDPFPGYVAPPLDGIWLTAPFLHNGSVPSIELVLDSSKRPQFWKRENYDSTNYDRDTLGWVWEELDYGQADAPFGVEIKHIYDTTIQGHENGGHTFGDHLTDDERAAVIEYLKTI